MEYQYYTFENGIRLVHQQTDRMVANLGFLVNAGARDEGIHEFGLAHFIEHTLFKGTKKRKAFHILSRLDDVGGEVNAYTTKEETCLYASFLKEYYPRTIELFFDILFNSTFPTAEIKKEKDVIIDEIGSYQDSPSELIFDEFEEKLFQGTGFGHNVLGTEKSVKSFDAKMVHQFMQKHYNTDQMVISSVGDIKMSKLIKLMQPYFGAVKSNSRMNSRKPISKVSSIDEVVSRDLFQAHCVMGGKAYDYGNEKRLSLYLINNLLGGPSMNSRLNFSLREKKGISYNVESVYTPYTDTGIINIYFGTDASNLNKSLKVVHQELKILREKKLGTIQLSKAKKQLIANLAMANENHENQMLAIGKSVLIFNKIDSIEEVSKKIEDLSSSDLLDVANEIFDPSNLNTLIFK